MPILVLPKMTRMPPASLRREDLGPATGGRSHLFILRKSYPSSTPVTRSLLSGDQRERRLRTLEESLRQHEATAEATEQATTEITSRLHALYTGTLGKGIRADPGVVWSEILTHIKGSPVPLRGAAAIARRIPRFTPQDSQLLWTGLCWQREVGEPRRRV